MNQEDYLRVVQEQQRVQAVKEAALNNFLTKNARERFKRVEIAHPDNANKALMIILQGVQSGRFKQVSDDLLKKILISLKEDKDYNIIRK